MNIRQKVPENTVEAKLHPRLDGHFFELLV